VQIQDRQINKHESPYVIAEIGAGWRNLADAVRLVQAAADAKADAIKIQYYTPDEMTINSGSRDFILEKGSPWAGMKLYDLYKKAAMPWDVVEAVFETAAQEKIPVIASVFGLEGLRKMEAMDCAAYKIASSENQYTGLICEVIATEKPVIISSGNLHPTQFAECIVQCADEMGNEDIGILHCIPSYPTPPDRAQLHKIRQLRNHFGDFEIGFSDHTLGSFIAPVAVALGATIIEKHIGYPGSADGDFCLRNYEFPDFVMQVKMAHSALRVHDDATPEEVASHQWRRSIYVVKDIKAGDAFTHDNIAVIRPSYGLTPDFLDLAFERRASVDIAAGTPLNLGHLSQEGIE